MAAKLSKTSSFFLLLFFFFSISFPFPSSLSASFTSEFVPRDNACNSTPHPNFCRSVLPPNVSGTIVDYCRASMRQSLSDAKGLSSLLQRNLTQSRQSLTGSTVQALQDCLLLTDLTQDFLSNALGAIDQGDDLDRERSEDLDTLLSAIVTNQDTCFDGLQASSSWSSIRDGLTTPLSNGMQLHSVSLGLFTQAWPPKGRRERLLLDSRKYSKISNTGVKDSDEFLSRVSSIHDPRIYEFVSRRKLLQTVGSDVKVSQMVEVNPNGSGNFTTINDAVSAAPNNTGAGNGYFLIHVSAGVYEEYVSIPKNKVKLMMVGDGINQTVITGNRSAVDGWTTFNSATFAVVGRNFLAVNITFRNTAGAIKHQAVAVRNGADLSAFYKCSFEGYQDTLYTHSLRQFYRECDIFGTVDFIFGNAAVVFQNCNIYPRLPLRNQFNAITAQGRADPNQNTGTSIQNCTIKAADDLASSNSTTRIYLGRPWKEYSRTVYMESFLDSLIDPSGWKEWSGNFALSTLYYAEFSNSGPGSNTTGRVAWPGYHVINATDAANFTVSGLIKGQFWLPQTSVPFVDGLL